ncbi:alanine acetyltransferase [Pantoea deleyi]|uniref:GNAT family N-acetyltransferase n=1 Tax=Pantoea deleyi TaxID=470932 RepID=A0A506QVG0_9GAMM|nr:GNAT family N-acetyltransferase [Pantoea deleyi]ORM84294.1 alanine acetyltransferase [Pantoea deleyi]TPV49616.1 GNAT family N-acetyltransferase [Pantoea deleyi]
MTLILREARHSDASLLNELGVRTYTHHFEKYWTRREELDEFLLQEYSLQAIVSSLAEPSVNWYIAETLTPVGFVKVTWQCQIPGTSRQGTLLNKLYLSEGTTGKSYGQLIFNEVADMAKEKGSDFLWLEVLKENARARRFYEKQGMAYIRNNFFNTATQHVTLHVLGMSL